MRLVMVKIRHFPLEWMTPTTRLSKLHSIHEVRKAFMDEDQAHPPAISVKTR